jgi:hypothetical protein
LLTWRNIEPKSSDKGIIAGFGYYTYVFSDRHRLLFRNALYPEKRANGVKSHLMTLSEHRKGHRLNSNCLEQCFFRILFFPSHPTQRWVAGIHTIESGLRLLSGPWQSGCLSVYHPGNSLMKRLFSRLEMLFRSSG